MQSSDPNLIIEQQDDVISFTLNNPAKGNCLSPDIVEGLIDTLEGAKNPRMATIRGNGKHFCTGFDLSDIEDLSDGDLLWRFVRIEILLQKVHKLPFPIVAFAQGQVVGAGADLFTSCWRRVATAGARFRMPGWNFELALGTRRLQQTIGTDNAREMLIDTRSVSAIEARDFGLVTDIAESEQWSGMTSALKDRACALPPFASREMLRLTSPDTDDLDLAAVVRTSGRPGLKKRILDYRELAQRKARERRNLS